MPNLQKMESLFTPVITDGESFAEYISIILEEQHPNYEIEVKDFGVHMVVNLIDPNLSIACWPLIILTIAKDLNRIIIDDVTQEEYKQLYAKYMFTPAAAIREFDYMTAKIHECIMKYENRDSV